MKNNEHICIICGEIKPLAKMTVLAELRGIGGRDLGYVCEDCIKHIDNLKYFDRREEDDNNE